MSIISRRELLKSLFVVGASRLVTPINLIVGASALYPSKAKAGPFGFVKNSVTVVNNIVAGQLASNSSGTGFANSVVVTFGSNIVVGNKVVVSCHCKGSSVVVSSISGLGATWTQLSSSINNTVSNTEIWMATCSTAGNAVTVNFSGTNAIAAVAQEFTGLSSTLDGVGGQIGNSANVLTGDCGPTSNPANLIFGAGTINNILTINSGPTNGFTALTSYEVGTNPNKITTMTAYKIVNAASTYSTDWTLSNSNSWAGTIVSIKST